MQPNDPSSFCLENDISRNCIEQPTSKPKDGPKNVPRTQEIKKSGDVALGGGIADGGQRYLVSMRLATAPKPALFNLQTHTSNSSLNMRRLPSSFH
jgi:hypothetical protein